MAQQDIIDFLKQNMGKKYSVSEIHKAIGLREEAIYHSLKGIAGKSISREYVVDSKNKILSRKFVYWIDASGKVLDSKTEFSDKQRLIHEIDEMVRDMQTALYNLNNRMDSFKKELDGYRMK